MAELVVAGAKVVPAAIAATKVTSRLLGRAFTDSELDWIHECFRIAIEAEIPQISGPERVESVPRRLVTRRAKRMASGFKRGAVRILTPSGRKERRQKEPFEDAVNKVVADLKDGFSPAQLRAALGREREAAGQINEGAHNQRPWLEDLEEYLELSG